MQVGVLPPGAIDAYRALLANLYVPLVQIYAAGDAIPLDDAEDLGKVTALKHRSLHDKAFRKPHHVQLAYGGALMHLGDLQDATKLSSLLEEVSSAARSACVLLPAPEHLLASVDLVKAGGLGRAADDPAILEAAAVALAGWCDTVEALLAEPETQKCVRPPIAQGSARPCWEQCRPTQCGQNCPCQSHQHRAGFLRCISRSCMPL